MDKAKLLEVSELKTETAEVVGVEGIKEVTVRELTLGECLEFEREATARSFDGAWVACLLVASIIDEGGNRLFDYEDAEWIAKLPANRFRKVINVARDMLDGANKPAEEISLEPAKKNSETILVDSSSG